MTRLGVGGNEDDLVRLRLAGRGDVEVRVRDDVVPAGAVPDGVWTHAVRVVAAGAARREVVVPTDPTLGRAAPRRAAAYVVGRYCAARALAAAGHPDGRVPVGDSGAPAWPAGLVGSISHADTRAVAVVGAAERWRGVGVDYERVVDAAVADEIVGGVLAEADAVEVAGDGMTWAELVTVGFSAKESLYKCLRPLVGVFFDFGDARLTRVDGETQRLRIRLVRDLAPGFERNCTFELRFAVAEGHVHTCLALPAATGR